MRTSLTRRCIVALLLSFAALPHAANANSAGHTPGTFAVSPTGSATYAIPIWVPPGYDGVQPNLTLVYDSRLGDGLEGPGWTMSGLSVISRCNGTFAQDGQPSAVTLTSSDRLCMDGRRLRLTSSGGMASYGQPGTTYQPELNDFSNVAASSTSAGTGPASFTVQRRDGLIYEYGNTTDSRVAAQGATTPYAWALDKVSDRYGNSMSITYANDQGSFRPDNIQYTTTSAGSTGYKVQFTYVQRPPIVIYSYGGAIDQAWQLTTITVTSGATLERQYNLTYTPSTSTQRNVLTGIQECAGTGGADCLTASTAISYQYGQSGINTPTTSGLFHQVFGKVYTVDIDGDGRSDLVYQNSAGHWVVNLAVPIGGYGLTWDTGIASTPGTPVLLDDFLGTGQTDLLAASGGAWYVYHWNPSSDSFVQTPIGVSVDPNVVPVTANYASADINGDGLPDLIWGSKDTPTHHSIYVALNQSVNATPFFGPKTKIFDLANFANPAGFDGIYGNNAFPYSTVHHMDFNGDGRGDLIIQSDTGFGVSFYTNLFASGTPQAPTLVPGNLAGGVSVAAFLPIRWNDDACTDLADTAAGTIFVSPCNTSAGITVGNIPVNKPTVAADWDGDGRMDLLVANGTTWTAYISGGSGVARTVDTGIPTSYNNLIPADQDGDGLADLVSVNSSGVTFGNHSGAGLATDLAATISDGWGNFATVHYTPITQGTYGNSQLGFLVFPDVSRNIPVYVADRVTLSDGIGQNFVQTHSYDTVAFNLQGRGFEGFGKHTVTDSRPASFKIVSFYNTAFPRTGTESEKDVYQNNQTTLVSLAHYNYNSTATDSDPNGHNEIDFVFLHDSSLDNHEVGGAKDGSVISTVTGAYTYDAYGNKTNDVTTVTDKDAYSGMAWTTTTASLFTPDHGTNWCVGLPTEVDVTRSIPSDPNVLPAQQTLTRKTAFTPDYVHCREATQVIAPNTPYAVTQTKTYDSAGNLHEVDVTGAGMPTRTTITGYDGHGRPNSFTDPSGATTTYVFDPATGVKTSERGPNCPSTDASCHAHTWSFDDFLRLQSEGLPDGTSQGWAYNDCASTTGCFTGTHGLVVNHTVFNVGGTVQTDETTYFDQLDRSYITSKRMLANGAYDRNELEYDVFGRVVKRSMPCTFSSLGVQCRYWETTSYDALSRPTQVQRQVDANNFATQSSTFTYSGDTRTATDPQQHQQTLVTDGAGVNRNVQDNNGYWQHLSYDAFGSLVSVVDKHGNALFSATYDYGTSAFQRSFNDADLGAWSYTYNALGELINWSDAKGQHFSASYDSLSRLKTRTELDLSTTWTWGSDPTLHEIYRLRSVSVDNGYGESYTYDSAARIATQSFTIPSDTNSPYVYAYSYDPTTQLIATLTYPVSTSSYRLKLQYGYQNGILQQISDAQNSATVFWHADSMNPRGQVAQATLGNGLVTIRTLDPVTGWLGGSTSGPNGSASLQNETYLYDLVGNLTQRQNNNAGLTENFTYDGVYRLSYSQLVSNGNTTTNFSASYDDLGNILSRSDVANGALWSYDPIKVHAVTQAGPAGAYSYDANGNMITRNGSSISWTSFNHPLQLSGAGEQVLFTYKPDHTRWRAILTAPTGTETTYFIGHGLDKVVDVGITDYRHYIYAANEKVAVVSRTDTGPVMTTRYIREDHLGSVSGISTSSGDPYVQESFSAFGSRRSTCTWSGPPTSGNLALINGVTRMGFTWQAALGDMGLNDMNGRIEDATIGRFLSADPMVPSAFDTQQFNRYSYVSNNPLTYRDPTGFDGCTMDQCFDDLILQSNPSAGCIGNCNFGGSGGSPNTTFNYTISTYVPYVGQNGAQAMDTGAELGPGVDHYGATVSIEDAAVATPQPSDLWVTVTATRTDWGSAYPPLQRNWRRTVLGDFGLSALEGFPGYGVFDCTFSQRCGGHEWAASIQSAMMPTGRAAGAVAEGVATLDASQILFSQSSVSEVDAVAASMRANGWVGAPVDVVAMDGNLVTLDNTRVMAAYLTGTPVQATIRGLDELLPAQMVEEGRFYSPRGGVQATTWGEAAANRIMDQNGVFRSSFPNGSWYIGVTP